MSSELERDRSILAKLVQSSLRTADLSAEHRAAIDRGLSDIEERDPATAPSFYALPENTATRFCRSCRRPIVFTITKNRKRAPLDLTTLTRHRESGRWYAQIHHVTCPAAEGWRRR